MLLPTETVEKFCNADKSSDSQHNINMTQLYFLLTSVHYKLLTCLNMSFHSHMICQFVPADVSDSLLDIETSTLPIQIRACSERAAFLIPKENNAHPLNVSHADYWSTLQFTNAP